MRSEKLLNSFIEFCKSAPDLRFWQALSVWSKWNYVYVSKKETSDKNVCDTFSWEDIIDPSTDEDMRARWKAEYRWWYIVGDNFNKSMKIYATYGGVCDAAQAFLSFHARNNHSASEVRIVPCDNATTSISITSTAFHIHELP